MEAAQSPRLDLKCRAGSKRITKTTLTVVLFFPPAQLTKSHRREFVSDY